MSGEGGDLSHTQRPRGVGQGRVRPAPVGGPRKTRRRDGGVGQVVVIAPPRPFVLALAVAVLGAAGQRKREQPQEGHATGSQPIHAGSRGSCQPRSTRPQRVRPHAWPSGSLGLRRRPAWHKTAAKTLLPGGAATRRTQGLHMPQRVVPGLCRVHQGAAASSTGSGRCDHRTGGTLAVVGRRPRPVAACCLLLLPGLWLESIETSEGCLLASHRAYTFG